MKITLYAANHSIGLDVDLLYMLTGAHDVVECYNVVYYCICVISIVIGR